MNDAGLTTIVEQVEKHFLSGNEPQALPEISGVLNDNIHYRFKNVKYLVNLEKFDITPRANYINIDMDVKRAFLSAAQLEIKTTLFGKKIEYVCSGLAVDFDKKQAQNISGDIGASIEKGNVKLDIQNIAYELQKKDINVTGPEHCTGLWGTRWIVKLLVNSTLKRFRSKLEEEMVHVLSDIVPLVEDILNEYTVNSFDIKFDGIEPFPAFAIKILLKPRNVSIDEEGLRFILNTEFDAEQRFKPRAEKSLKNTFFTTDLGDIGFSPNIASDVLAEVFPNGLDYIELNRFIPAINEYLTTSTASVVWPAIVNEDLTETYLKVAIRVRKIPNFYIDSEFKELVIDINDVDVLFKVNKNGEWKDYFKMNTDARAFTKARIYNGVLSFQVDEKSEVFVDGEFLGEFAQQADIYYDPEMAEFILSGVLDFLHGSAPLLGLSIPVSEIAGLKVGAERVYFDDKYARVGISKSN